MTTDSKIGEKNLWLCIKIFAGSSDSLYPNAQNRRMYEPCTKTTVTSVVGLKMSESIFYVYMQSIVEITEEK
ncbi:hypothetical protein DERF_009318 [Dermatophagoides farinae]|uniref:Uncharacterized protein n=1 Tax=Dermatophagoides farinae TaxID=6954 RepID=A0A922HTR5_DERFA|nr:hypothetical protein DERF_009318 [Dermatophagoides farinae]